eukprot:scaffold244_cov172-Amphora_coffeaeformis.AAC.25
MFVGPLKFLKLAIVVTPIAIAPLIWIQRLGLAQIGLGCSSSTATPKMAQLVIRALLSQILLPPLLPFPRTRQYHAALRRSRNKGTDSRIINVAERTAAGRMSAAVTSGKLQ